MSWSHEENGAVKARPRGKADGVNQNVCFFPGVLSGKGGEEFLRGRIRSNVQRVKPPDGRKLVLEFEDPTHEALLVPQIQGHTSSSQLLANRPSDGILTGHTEHKGRFTLEPEHEKPPWG